MDIAIANRQTLTQNNKVCLNNIFCVVLYQGVFEVRCAPRRVKLNAMLYAFYPRKKLDIDGHANS